MTTTRSRLVLLFCALIVLGFCSQLIQVAHQVARHQPWPLSPPLHYPRDVFMDFFNTNAISRHAHPYAVDHATYPPFNLVVARFFAFFGDYSVKAGKVRSQIGGLVSLALFLGLYIAALYWTYRQSLRRLTVHTPLAHFTKILLGSAFFLCAPFWVSIDRSNYVALAFVFFTAFIFAPEKDSPFALAMLAAACSIKPYLGLALCPLVWTYGWRFAARFTGWFAVFNAGGALIIGPADVRHIFSNMLHYGDAVTLAHRLYESINLSNLFCPEAPMAFGAHGPMSSHVLAGGLLLLLGIVTLSRKSLDEKLFCATIIAIALPPIAYQYNLILLIPFWASVWERSDEAFGDLTVVVLALTMIWWHHVTLFSGPMRGVPFPFQLHVTEQSLILPMGLALLLLMMVAGLLVRRPGPRPDTIRS